MGQVGFKVVNLVTVGVLRCLCAYHLIYQLFGIQFVVNTLLLRFSINYQPTEIEYPILSNLE